MTRIEKTICDRCGNECDDGDYGAEIRDRRDLKEYDVCKNCLFDLRSWLRTTPA